MVNSIGGLAGFVSPYLVGWVADRTHRLDAGLYVIASFLFLGVILVLSVVPAHLAGVPAHEPGAGGTPDRGGAPRTTQ